jgi:hypothetical protein
VVQRTTSGSRRIRWRIYPGLRWPWAIDPPRRDAVPSGKRRDAAGRSPTAMKQVNIMDRWYNDALNP